jgi:membrane fusion protein (multidrug efflux system)
VDIDNKDGELLPGMYATVIFNLPRTVKSILIPSEALVFRADGTTVAIVDNQHTVRFLKVVVGHDYGASIEITSGLSVGDLVVVNPNDTTFEGAKVIPMPIKEASGSLLPASRSAPTQSGLDPSAPPGKQP